MAYERDEDYWDGDELRPEVRQRLLDRIPQDLRVEEKKENALSMAQLVQWVPVYLAFIGLFFSGANVYANTMTRIATIETRLDLLTQVITELKTEIRYEREQGKQQRASGK